jgi:hypothetical protein
MGVGVECRMCTAIAMLFTDNEILLTPFKVIITTNKNVVTLLKNVSFALKNITPSSSRNYSQLCIGQFYSPYARNLHRSFLEIILKCWTKKLPRVVFNRFKSKKNRIVPNSTNN